MELLKRLIVEEEGQNIVEYALMIGLVVLIIWVAVQTSGVDSAVSTIWANVKSSLEAASAS
ncbi:MAG: Flp family type IVb pilin [Candidatus Binatia bacterium]